VIVDFHTHILPESFAQERERLRRLDRTFAALFPNDKARLASTAMLLQSMEKWGIDRAIALGYGWTDPGVARESNDYLLDAARTSGGRIVPFCSVDPTLGDEAVREVERCALAGAHGIGELHPDSQRFDVADRAVLAPVMEVAARLHLVVLTHASEPLGHTYPGKGTVWPSRLAGLASNFPGVKFVFAHWGGGLPFYMLMPELNRDLTNVWFDSAATPLLYRESVYSAAAESAGAGRLLFGSDYPLINQGRAMDGVRAAGLDSETQRAVLGENALALLDL